MSVKIFSTVFDAFLTEVMGLLPGNADVVMTKNAVLTLRKANPKMMPKMWKCVIVGPYEAHIAAGNIQFFLDHDYRADLERMGADMSQMEKVIAIVDSLKASIAALPEESLGGAMAYIQRLTVIAKTIS
jgi:hypothetical protein